MPHNDADHYLLERMSPVYKQRILGELEDHVSGQQVLVPAPLLGKHLLFSKSLNLMKVLF